MTRQGPRPGGRIWGVLTVRGRWLAGAGLVALLAAMISGQRDVMRVALLLLALPLVALVLADAALEKFGGDSLAETARNAAAYRDAIDPLRAVGGRP